MTSHYRLVLGFFFIVGLLPPALANDDAKEVTTASPMKAESIADCSKETWPNFSPSCLRNGSQNIQVRLVNTSRR
jgi:hypothetical protein